MKTKILIVDDIEANRFSLNALFEEYLENVEAILASSGEEALEIVYDQNIDLIILDIQMPGLDGFETAKFIKENPKTKDIPIIFLTAAFKKEEFRQKGFRLGAIDYLTKPIDNDQLVNKLRLYIELFTKNKEILEKEEIMLAQSRYSAMSEVTSMIAHQWRQPLASISIIASNMQLEVAMGDAKGEEFETECEQIIDATNSLSKIINNFAYFFKSDEEKSKIGINEILEDVYNIISPSLEVNNFTIKKELLSQKKINIYKQEIKQVIISIIKNSMEVLSARNIKEPFILLKSWEDNKNVYFSVSDNGGGIEEKNIDKIYNPYFSTKTEKNSVGLGLYMSKAIIQKHHNGNIISYNEKNGACFKVTIPI